VASSSDTSQDREVFAVWQIREPNGRILGDDINKQRTGSRAAQSYVWVGSMPTDLMHSELSVTLELDQESPQ
jgi:hypothetical protein